MVRVRVVPKEEAQQTRRAPPSGVRQARREEFDAYVQELLANPDQALVFEKVSEVEPVQTFRSSLKAAFRRAGRAAHVGKVQGRDEVRSWLLDEQEQAAAARAGRRLRRTPV